MSDNGNKQGMPKGLRRGGHGPGMGPVEKPKDFKGSLKRLVRYLSGHKVALSIVILTTILSTVFTIFAPKVLGWATTSLSETIFARAMGNVQAAIDFSYIGKVLLFLLGLYVLSAFFQYIQQYVMAGVSQRVVYDMRKQIDEKLDRLPLKYYDGRTHGEILSRVTNDVETISSTLQQGLSQMITAVATLAGILIMMLSISPLLTLIALVILPLSAIVVSLVVSKSQKYFMGQQRHLGEANGHIEEMYPGHTVIKAYGLEKKSIGEFRDTNEKLYTTSWKSQFISGIMMPLMNFIGNLGFVGVCVIGCIRVVNGRMALGDVQAFIQYVRNFTQPIVQTAQIANVIQSTIAAAERVFEVLDEQEESPDSETAAVLENPQGNIRFEHVHFGYSDDDILIRDMNIEARKGQTVAIVGPTGAGKTTLVNLMMRFYEIQGGHILVDNVDIRTMTRNDLRTLFGMVLQDTWLFSGTVEENIAYGCEGATHDDVVKAAKAAFADHFIRTLPQGYNTVLNEEASNISQGQKQLLTIARAILADPPMLILDEATSNVDTRTEAHIQKAMDRLMEGRTSFVIAHRLSTIRDADLILVMNHGAVIEQGNHAELMRQGGFYADLYNSQFTTRDGEEIA